MRRKPLGQILVSRGIIAPATLRDALELQRTSGARLATLCHAQGFAEEENLLAALSSQVGVPGISMLRLVLPLKVLELVPEQTAARGLVLPVRADGERIFLAMANPDDETLIGELSFLSSKQVIACVALEGLLRRAIGEAYTGKRRGELDYQGEQAAGSDALAAPVDLVCSPELAQVPARLRLPSISGKSGGERSSTAEPFAEILIDDEDGEDDLVVPPQPEDGSSSAIEIPVAAALLAAAADSPAPDPTPGPRGRAPIQVLVVDDDPELRQLICRVLRAKRFATEEASRGLEALTAIKRSPPDLLILDAMLPEIHGFDICRKIKGSDRYAEIPIIMISSIYRGWRFARDLKEAYGVDAFLEKPFTIDQLWNTVERVLARGRRVAGNGAVATRAEEHFREALGRFQAGEIDGAIESCREGLRADPLSAKLHYQLGVLLLKKKGMHYQAMQSFEEAVTLDGELFSAQRILAILYQRRGFKNKAIEMWERALRSCGDDQGKEEIRNHLRSLI